MLKKTAYGKTGLEVSRIAMGGASYGIVNYSTNWNPYTEEGRKKAVDTIRYGLDRGINYIDTAPGYGLERHSEKIMGDAVRGRRDQVVIASKVSSEVRDRQSVIDSVEESLRCLKTDYIDILQLHGGAYEADQIDCLLGSGPVDALEELKRQGKIRNIGFTVEAAVSAQPLLVSGRFDMVQVCYNITNITASYYLLDQAKETGMGVTVMRPLASGMFAQLMEYLAPEISADTANAVALRFVLSDSRVNVVDIGMRSREEIDRNIAMVESYEPVFDMAAFPRLLMSLYKMQDENKGKPWRPDENYLK